MDFQFFKLKGYIQFASWANSQPSIDAITEFPDGIAKFNLTNNEQLLFRVIFYKSNSKTFHFPICIYDEWFSNPRFQMLKLETPSDSHKKHIFSMIFNSNISFLLMLFIITAKLHKKIVHFVQLHKL